MAAVYAPPISLLGNDRRSHGHSHSHNHSYIHGHGHGHRHGHGYGHLHESSHHQKLTAQRIPLKSINGVQLVQGEQLSANSPKTHAHSYSVPSRSQINSSTVGQQQPEPNLPPPSIHSSLITSNGRPKSMERRRSSVGLPTHLRLGSSGYGFPPVSSQKYMSISDGTKRCGFYKQFQSSQ